MMDSIFCCHFVRNCGNPNVLIQYCIIASVIVIIRYCGQFVWSQDGHNKQNYVIFYTSGHKINFDINVIIGKDLYEIITH